MAGPIKQIIAIAAIGLVASGCAPWFPTSRPNSAKTETVTPTTMPVSAQIHRWYADVQPYFAELADAGRNMATAAQAKDLVGFGFACEKLHDAAGNIQAHMPTPDLDLTRELQGAISDYDAASRFCIAGSQNLNVGELEDSLPLLRSASTKMDTVNSILHRDTGDINAIPPTSAQPTVSTPSRSLPGTDGQGFVASYARCESGNPPALMAQTTKSQVVVCQTGPGDYYYRGVRMSDGASIELANAVRTSSGFDITNPADGTRYQIRRDVLNIISPGGHVDSEPMVQYVPS